MDDLDATIPVKPPAGAAPRVTPPITTNGTANPDAPMPLIFGELIARGGMGAVLRAQDCKLPRIIAAKIILDGAEADETQRQRFINEAAVLARLAHPNIVPVYDIGRDPEGQLYYTMKLVKGRTLQEIIDDLRLEHHEALREYTLDRLLNIFRKVCDALAFAHSRRIIHRDLKPENIMVGEFGEVLVMDWGLAKMLVNDEGNVSATASDPEIGHSSFTATLQGAVMGTPKFMSPEQAMGRIDELDERSDIFSLGGMLYAILTLRPPVEGKTLEEVLAKVSSASITPPTAFGATAGGGANHAKGAVLDAKAIKPLPHIPAGRVPAALSSVAMKALTLDKTKRYQHVTAFGADIEKYQGGFATSAENAGVGKQLVLLMLRHKAVTVALAAMLLLSVGFVIKVMASERETRRQADIAQQNEKKAVAAESVAVREKETARQALAKSQLDLAEKEFERGKFVEAQKILDDTPESFRDANWRFLCSNMSDFTAQFSIPGKGTAQRLLFLPQGDRFVARCFVDCLGVFTLAGKQLGGWIPADGKEANPTPSSDATGARLAFAPSLNEIGLLDVTSGKVLRRWTCELGNLTHVVLSPDGQTVLAVGKNEAIAYATQTAAPLWRQQIKAVAPAFSPDGLMVAVVSALMGPAVKVQLLDPHTGIVQKALEATGDNASKSSLQFNRAGDRLACLGGDEVIFWNVKTGLKERGLHFPGESFSLLSPRGDAVATTSGSRIRLWETATGRLLRTLNGATTRVVTLAFSPDGKTLLSSHYAGAGAVMFWPTRIGEGIADARSGTFDARQVLFDRDGSRFYACALHSAGSWETRGGLQKWNFSKFGHYVWHLAIHPSDGSIIISEHDKATLTRVTPAGEVLESFGTNASSRLQFSRSGENLLTVEGAFRQTDPGLSFNVMQYPSGKLLRRVPLENPHQPFAAFCLKDAAVATAALAGGITVWDWQAGKPLRQVDATQTGSIACLAASPDGQHLVTGGPDRWIRVWEATTGRLESAFRAHWEGVRSVKFSRDGREILSGGEDGTVRIHNALSGERTLVFYGLTTPVTDVDFSPDGKLVAAITTDGFVKVWDRKTSSEAAMLPQRSGK